MLDIKFVRNHIEDVEAAMAARGDTKGLAGFRDLEAQSRSLLTRIEQLRAERKTVSAKIGELKKKGEDTTAIQEETRRVSDKIKDMEAQHQEKEQKLSEILITIPNIPDSSVPHGLTEDDNQLLRLVGEPRKFDFTPQAHWDIGEKCRILDFPRAAKITGSRFPLYYGQGALLERALIQFMLNTHTQDNGYLEVLPPFIVNRQSMTGTGQLPKFEEDLFRLDLDDRDYFLIPTAEVPVTNLHAGEILKESDLPLFYTAYTPCFRAEAGAHGKDTRGLIRQHQFNKVELVKFTLPEESWDQLESLLENAEGILKSLGLPYRVVTLCTGDLGFSASKTYDIEVWMPAQDKYREISSCSNFTDFQARRADIRFRREGKKGTEFVHTLNGSGLAVGRAFAAILENFQQEDGSVAVPEALRPYMNGVEAITP